MNVFQFLDVVYGLFFQEKQIRQIAVNVTNLRSGGHPGEGRAERGRDLGERALDVRRGHGVRVQRHRVLVRQRVRRRAHVRSVGQAGVHRAAAWVVHRGGGQARVVGEVLVSGRLQLLQHACELKELTCINGTGPPCF